MTRQSIGNESQRPPGQPPDVTRDKDDISSQDIEKNKVSRVKPEKTRQKDEPPVRPQGPQDDLA